MASTSILEHYSKRHLSLILYVPAGRNGDVIGRVLSGSHREPWSEFAPLVLRYDSINGRVVNCRNEQAVFVANVELVNGPDGPIPSLVRLYLVHHQVEQMGTGRVYFFP